MTKLEQHREVFIVNRRTGPMLRLEDLQVEEYEILNRDFLARTRGSDKDATLESIYEVYLQTLSDWGVICPHPLGYREFPEKPGSCWYTCKLCNSAVLNP